MKWCSLRQLLLVIAGLLAFHCAAGDISTDSAQRVEHKRADLVATKPMEVIASTAEYQPGDRIDLHSHHGIEVAYVLQGASIQVDGKPPVTLATGSTLMNLRDLKHAGFKVVGESPLKLFTVHVVDKGAPLYDFR